MHSFFTQRRFFLYAFFINALIFSNLVSGQTTITTTGASYTGNNGLTAPAHVTFVIENANASGILLTTLGQYCQTSENNATWSLYYSATSLSGTSTLTTPPWTLIATSGTIPVTATGIVTVLTNLNFLIPGGTQYRFWLRNNGPGSCRYSGTGAAITPNTFSSGGVNLKLGDVQIAGNPVGYGGTGTTITATFAPRYFTGFITFTPAAPCTGKPTAGIINPITPCANTNFILTSTTPLNQGTGITYDWQKSPNGTSGWTSLASTINATDNISALTFYRLILTCTNSTAPNNADTTPVLHVGLASFLDCYCIPTYATGGANDYIANVVLGQLTNPTTGNASPYYRNYTTQQPSPIPISGITMGAIDTVKVTMGPDANQYSAVWIDFDRNGVFSTTEYFTTGTNAGANGTAKIPITIPANITPGITRMRVRGGDNSQMNANQACAATNSANGEAEDYLVEIRYPPCSGPTDAGIAHTTDTAICPDYFFTLTDTSHAIHLYGISWSWQQSTTLGNTWYDVPNSAGKDTLNRKFVNTTWFRLRMICSLSSDTTYSNVIKINLKPPYKCYCYSIAIGGLQDTSDIGAFSIGNFSTTSGGPHTLNPTANKGRTDYTNLPPIVLYTDSVYRVTVFHTMNVINHADARVTVFMDFNNNLLYDVPNESVYLHPPAHPSDWLSTTTDWFLTSEIHIPSAAIPDMPTGMRVIINNDVAPNVPSDQACGPYTSGETEDYVVIFRRKSSLGIANNIQGLGNLLVYPNPSTGAFTVSGNIQTGIENMEISISDITGRIIHKFSYDNISGNFTKRIDLSDKTKGVYFIEVKANSQKAVRKIILQ